MGNLSNTTNANRNRANTTPNTTPNSTAGNTGKTANTTTTAAATRPRHEGATSGGMQQTKHAPHENAGANASSRESENSTLIASRDAKDFKLTPPMVDVRGWNVALANGDTVGTVERIMLDSREHKPRYLAVTPTDRKGQMLLPIGVGTVDRDHRRVVLRDLEPDVLKSPPLITHEVITRDMERSIFGTVKGAKVTDQTVPQIYTDPLYDASRLFGSKGAPANA